MEQLGWTDTDYGILRLRVDPDHEVFVIPPTGDFIYTGSVQPWVVPETGQYLLEVWGADGGPVPNSIFNGRGGYSAGLVWLTQGETLWVYVGGRGEASLGLTNHINQGGFNGGGFGRNSSTGSPGGYRTGGGGASDIRAMADTLNNRIIVSGGGGGNSGHSANMTAGNGGDLVGGFGSHHAGAITPTAWGGTQTAGGNGQTANTSPSDFGVRWRECN